MSEAACAELWDMGVIVSILAAAGLVIVMFGFCLGRVHANRQPAEIMLDDGDESLDEEQGRLLAWRLRQEAYERNSLAGIGEHDRDENIETISKLLERHGASVRLPSSFTPPPLTPEMEYERLRSKYNQTVHDADALRRQLETLGQQLRRPSHAVAV